MNPLLTNELPFGQVMRRTVFELKDVDWRFRGTSPTSWRETAEKGGLEIGDLCGPGRGFQEKYSPLSGESPIKWFRLFALETNELIL